MQVCAACVLAPSSMQLAAHAPNPISAHPLLPSPSSHATLLSPQQGSKKVVTTGIATRLFLALPTDAPYTALAVPHCPFSFCAAVMTGAPSPAQPLVPSRGQSPAICIRFASHCLRRHAPTGGARLVVRAPCSGCTGSSSGMS